MQKCKLWWFPHNPDGEHDDIREELRKTKKLKWNITNPIKNIEINDYVLLYISGKVKRVEFILKVVEKESDYIELELISELDKELKNKLTLNKLEENGHKKSSIYFCISNNETLFNYIKDVLKNNNIFENFIKNSENLHDENNNLKEKTMKNIPLNQILYGPPGTGKTYRTINKTLEIIFEKEDENKVIQYEYLGYKLNKNVKNLKKILNKYTHTKEDRKDLKTAFEYYKEQGQIRFVTFHQSFSYEDFIEGISANTDVEGNIRYDVKPGIFKEISKRAEGKIDFKINKNSKIWKISAGENQRFKGDFFENNLIRIGFRDECPDDLRRSECNNDFVKKFYQDLNKGDIVLVYKSRYEIDGVGIIEGDYEFDKNHEYPHKRKVRWIVKNCVLNIKELNNGKQLSEQTLYLLDRIDIEKLFDLINEKCKSDKNYILIIDEINRGNISKIFGELITLIEPSKRLGADEEITITLPYSNEEFGVPQNLYILGTMNTADRSIALLDTALRRRFEFIEMMPNPELLDGIIIEGIDIKKLLETMNKRIEYLYDRDHTIGHSYFMSLKENPTLEELANIFRNKIIPLLQEYFYDDFEKIKLVLNDNGFIREEPFEQDLFITNVEDIEDKKIYKIDYKAFSVVENYKKIYEKNKNENDNN